MKKWYVIKKDDTFLQDGEDTLFFEDPKDGEDFIKAVIEEGTLDMTGAIVVEYTEEEEAALEEIENA